MPDLNRFEYQFHPLPQLLRFFISIKKDFRHYHYKKNAPPPCSFCPSFKKILKRLIPENYWISSTFCQKCLYENSEYSVLPSLRALLGHPVQHYLDYYLIKIHTTLAIIFGYHFYVYIWEPHKKHVKWFFHIWMLGIRIG